MKAYALNERISSYLAKSYALRLRSRGMLIVGHPPEVY
jgi:hypothetical protein